MKISTTGHGLTVQFTKTEQSVLRKASDILGVFDDGSGMLSVAEALSRIRDGAAKELDATVDVLKKCQRLLSVLESQRIFLPPKEILPRLNYRGLFDGLNQLQLPTSCETPQSEITCDASGTITTTAVG